MSLRGLWRFLAVALPVVASLLASLSTVDLAYHLRAGADILATGSIPRIDTWTFTADGLPWVDQQWGAQVILAAVDRLGGWTALALLRAALVGAIFAATLRIGLRRGLPAMHAALLTIAAFVVASPALALRPQLFGMVLFAGTLVLVADRRRRPAGLWLIPLLTLLWANVHGSFFLAPVVLGLAWLADLTERDPVARRTLLVGLVSSAAAALTPFGPTVWAYAIGLASDPDVTRRITEWQPTTIRDGPGILMFLSLAAVVVLLARRGRSTPWPTLAWLGVFATIGLYAQRGVAWWPLAAAAAVVDLLPAASTSRSEPTTPDRLRRLNVLVAAAVLLAGLALVPAWRPIDARTGVPAALLTDAPPGVTAALRDLVEPGEHVFNPQPWGSWFEFAVPNARVAIDSRIELYPSGVWDAYLTVLEGRDGWQAQLDAWAVAVVVVDDPDGAQRARLEAAGWNTIYVDEDGAILGRGATASDPSDPAAGG